MSIFNASIGRRSEPLGLTRNKVPGNPRTQEQTIEPDRIFPPGESYALIGPTACGSVVGLPPETGFTTNTVDQGIFDFEKVEPNVEELSPSTSDVSQEISQQSPPDSVDDAVFRVFAR